MSKEITYSLSADNYGDGKSVCLWRQEGNILIKIARFQNDEAAKLFAKEMIFPLSDSLKKRYRSDTSAWVALDGCARVDVDMYDIYPRTHIQIR